MSLFTRVYVLLFFSFFFIWNLRLEILKMLTMFGFILKLFWISNRKLTNTFVNAQYFQGITKQCACPFSVCLISYFQYPSETEWKYCDLLNDSIAKWDLVFNFKLVSGEKKCLKNCSQYKPLTILKMEKIIGSGMQNLFMLFVIGFHSHMPYYSSFIVHFFRLGFQCSEQKSITKMNFLFSFENF